MHLIDIQRTGDRIISNGSTKKPDLYMNDPAEFNARYHDVADPWLNLIFHVQDDPINARDYMSLLDITGNIQTDLRKLLSTANRHNQHFLRHLNPTRRKAMLRRLYLLHREMMQQIAQAENGNIG